MDKVLDIFAPHCQFITWTETAWIATAIREHYCNGKSEDELEQFVNQTYLKNRKLKLLNGEYWTKAMTSRPYIEWISANTKLIIDELKPDIWSTDHESDDMPDFMKIPRFGLFHEGGQDEYMNGTREHRIGAVTKKYSLRSIIKSYDTLPTV